MKAPVPSMMGTDLQALGLDPKNLPPMEKLDPKALRGVMKLLARSLGGKCADCHTEGDFAAQTRRKKIATKMWDELAAKLTLADGSPMFCDSCHQGRITQLDRTDKKALAKWMETSFVDGLKRKDGKAEECESCHVGMEMHFLAEWGK
ncbi:MAG: cytochrome c3 family protein [Polyangiaceae bacterium]